jgi:hypothetical protein
LVRQSAVGSGEAIVINSDSPPKRRRGDAVRRRPRHEPQKRGRQIADNDPMNLVIIAKRYALNPEQKTRSFDSNLVRC